MDELDEKVLDIQQRQKRAQIMRRYKSKIERAREIAKKRMAPEANIRKRAFVQARQIIRRRVAGQRGAEYEKLGPSEKMAIDRAVEGKQKAIKKLALRLIPRVKQAEAKRLHTFMKGQQLQNLGQPEGKSKESSGSSSVKESLNNLFQEAFPQYDTSNALGQKVDSPVASSNGKKMPAKDKSKNSDIIQHNKFQEEVEYDTPAFAALFKKSEKSGIDLETLGEVYNRGWNSWTEGLKVTQEQYAFARVNSYINQGKTYFNEDADLHEGRAPGRAYVAPFHDEKGNQKGWKSSNKWGKVKYWQPFAKASALKHAGLQEEEVQQTNENFMDGKGPGKPGDSARHGLKGKSAAELRKIRSSETASPRKKQLAHWMLNMHHNEETNVNENLRQWFKDKWVRMDTKGEIKGDCAREEGEGKPKCLPLAKARAMDKDDRAKAARRKRREDPVADRPGKGGKPVNVQTEAANPAQQAAIAIALIKAGKKKGKVPANEEYIEEKSTPTNPALWSRAKSLARQKFDVYPSAYANGWAAKWYKARGGRWNVGEAALEESYDVNSKHYKALTDLDLNTKNRDMTTKHDGYGPLNPLDKKGSKAFWEDKAKMWNTTVEAAMEARCRNCAAFNQAPAIMKKMAEGLGPAGHKIQDLANLGFCELFEFKCAGDRTCNKWLVNGPITEEDTGNGTQLVDKLSKNSKIRRKIEVVDRKPPHTEYTRQAEIKHKIIDEDHPNCGTPECCGQCDTAVNEKLGNIQKDPKKRLIGTDSLVRAYKADTPFSENLDESFNIAFAAGVGVTLTAADLGMQARGGFAYHPSVIQQMEEQEVEEEVRSADVKGVVVRTSNPDGTPGRTIVRKQKVNRKIVGTGNLTDGKPNDTL